MRRQLIALLLLVQLVFALAAVVPAQAAGMGSIAGRVFVDANGNGMAESGEAAVAQATVTVVSQADASHAYEVITDSQGQFLFTGLDYGLYDVSASVDGTVPQGHSVIEIAEVNAQVLLDLPLYQNVDINLTVTSGRLFLPLLKP